LVRLSAERFHQKLKDAGFASLKEDGDWYGYSLALGSADVSLLMLANAYRTLANGGQWMPLRVTPGKNESPLPCQNEGCTGVFSGKPHRAFTPASAFLVSDILADRNARAGTFGLESWLATPYWAAAKTGTSKDMRDNWCAGYSRRYTVAVWVGNASGSPMHDVSGISGAAPVWREVMDWLHRGDPQHARAKVSSLPPTAPPGVIQQKIRFEPPREAPRSEWFITGTETSIVRAATGNTLARISYPADGSIIALDPDIPPPRQRVPLRTSATAEPGSVWRMDSALLGKTGSVNSWLPQPGKHRLRLESRSGEVIDSVTFEVRALKGRGR
jgi:penicillin-binding protein 1C